MTVDQSCQLPLSGFDAFARAAHRTRRSILLTKSLVCYKGIELGNHQMEDMRSARYAGRGSAFMTSATLPPSLGVQPENFEPLLWGFLWRRRFLGTANEIMDHCDFFL